MRTNKILLAALIAGFATSALAGDVQSVDDRGFVSRAIDGIGERVSKARNWIDDLAGSKNAQVVKEARQEEDAKNLPRLIEDSMIDKSLKDGGWHLCSNADIFDGFVFDKAPCRTLQSKFAPFQIKYVMLKTNEAAQANPVAVHGLKGCTKEAVDRGTGHCGKLKARMNGIEYRFVVEAE